MRVCITGAGGYLGQELVASLLQDPIPNYPITELALTDLYKPPTPRPSPKLDNIEVTCISTDLSDHAKVQSLLSHPPDIIFLFHGIMSGAAESNLDLGLEVNLTASMNILNVLRKSGSPVKVIYASVLAAYGPPSLQTNLDQPIDETNTAPNPQSSYGTAKCMVELLVNDFSRRGFIDGRILRLPTIMPRAGEPTGAASSFASDIVREPLNGRRAILPVSDKQLKMYVCSPRTIIQNFRHAMTISVEEYEKSYKSRVVIMPGTVATVQDVLDAVVATSPLGRKVLDLIEHRPDEAVDRIVSTWPYRYNMSRAQNLGFQTDPGLRVAIQEYYDRHVKSL